MTAFLGVAGLSRALALGNCSSVELTRHFLERIKRFDERLNAYITLDEAGALAAAQAADQRRSRGAALGPLDGIPLAHKDIFCTKGLLTTCGSRMLGNFKAPYDATVAARLAAQGMVLLGKTNMDEFAMGSSNETSFFGPVRNPWDESRVPGGSSGGSAAAVAAGLAPIATGTDTGGSVRQPAALCGISGLKPTYGRVSRYGMIAFASSLDQAGLMGRSAADIALVLQAIAGLDERDATSAAAPVPDYTEHLERPLAGLRIGMVEEFFGPGVDGRVAAVVEQARSILTDLGLRCTSAHLRELHLALPAYYILAPAEASSNLARYDGVRYGYRCAEAQTLQELYARSRSEGFGAEVKRRILIGTYVLSRGYYDAFYLQAQRARHLIADDFRQAFQDVDILLGPTAPETAFALGAKTADPLAMYQSDINTIPVNLAGLPAISIPCGEVDGLPVGLQLIGRPFSEELLLAVAHRFQQASDHHRRIPEAFS
jgi:aspartyl-tRNA(Asn)/glutamyl-tRNA(Gln) amidotransferase subunit A